MSIRTAAIAAVVAACPALAAAVPVGVGDTIRGAYVFPTFGAETLTPTSFFLRLSTADLFGGGDAVGFRYLDAALAPLSFTRLAPVAAGLDPTVGVVIEPSDFPTGAPQVPRTGFVEITGLAGSFDVRSLTLFAMEDVGASRIARQSLVDEFAVVASSPAPIPAPASLLLLLSALATLAFSDRRRRLFPQA